MSVRFLEPFPFGCSWVGLEQAALERCSHALAVGGKVWAIDPIAGNGVLERIRALGEPAGVLVLFQRHDRDSVAIAQALGVARHVVPELPAGAPFEAVDLGRGEVALWWADAGLLVVPEAMGTVGFMRSSVERVGLHPTRRLTPPSALLAYEPEHLLVGHGEGLHGPGTAAALHHTIRHGRRHAPGWLWGRFRAHVLRR